MKSLKKTSKGRAPDQAVAQPERSKKRPGKLNPFLRSLIQAWPVAIITLDSHGNVLEWNPAAERIFGWSKEEALGRPHPIVPESEREEFERLFDRVLKGESFSGVEVVRRRKDGSMIDINLSIAPLRDPTGPIKGSIGIFEEIGERKRAEVEKQQYLDQIRAGRERMQELSRRLVELQETERRGLARELHDEVGQILTALSLNLNQIKSLLPAEIDPRIRERIDDSQRLVEETALKIRDAMAKLRPPVLDDYGIVAALNWYRNQFSDRTGIAVVLEGKDLNPRLPLTVETALFRIAQEALNNVAKHARATETSLTIEEEGGKVRLTIADNGVGFDPESHHRPGARPEWGLINIRERARFIGGQLRVETAPGKGTRIIVEVPR